MDKKVRLGIIGYGNMGSWHGENVNKRIEGLTVTCVYDIEPERRALAKENGLTEIAIADHGFGHLLYGMKRKDLPALRQEISDAEKETGIKIFLGVEANFTSLNGDIDITEKDLENIEILLHL